MKKDSIENYMKEVKKRLEECGIDFANYNQYQRVDLITAFKIGYDTGKKVKRIRKR